MTTDTQSEPLPSKRNRRWMQFGMRALLGLVALTAIGLGLVVNSAHRQARAVASVRSLGGEVQYEAERWSQSGSQAPTWFRDLFGDDYRRSVTVVYLSDTQVGDAELASLQDLTSLEDVYLCNTQVSDAGLVRLTRLAGLRGLDLMNTRISDAGLECLTDLSQLQWLNLEGTVVTDAALPGLSKLTGLQGLDLSNTRVSDAGLVHLKTMSHLQSLSLVGAQVTEAGIASLRASLPDCHIFANGQRLPEGNPR